MKFNQNIIDKISPSILDSGLLYLLGIRFNLNTDIIPDRIKRKINMLEIVERDLNTNTIFWIIPLFSGEERAWDWVNEYRELFRSIRKDAGGTTFSCTRRMQKFFQKHPSLRSKEVLEAAKIYLEPFQKGIQNPQYLQKADYFIYKGVGINISSRLEEYLEIHKELSEKKEQENIKSNFIPS
jgi:hypothetical protein